MKRKLLCIFLVIAGTVTIAVTIPLSLGRHYYIDLSPAWALIIISIVTIAAAAQNVKRGHYMYELPVLEKIFYVVSVLAILAGLAFLVYSARFYTLIIIIIGAIPAIFWFRYANRVPHKLEVSGCKKVFLWIFYIVSVLAILANLALIVLFGNIIYTIIFIIIVTIAAAVWFRHANDELDEPEVTRRGMVFLQISRIVSILVILVSLGLIVVMFSLTGSFGRMIRFFQGMHILMILALTGISAAALSLKLRAPVSGRGIGRAVRYIPIAVAVAIIAAFGFIYLNDMPKYSLDEAYNIVRSDEEFSQNDVFYLTFEEGETTGSVARMTTEPRTIEGKTFYYLAKPESFGGNPFYAELFQFYCDSYSCDNGGLHIMKGYILFNPATGAYEYTRAQEQDAIYSPGELPEFNYHLPWINNNFMYKFMYDKDERHGAVLNLFLREQWPYIAADGTYEEYSVSSGQWDAKLPDIMYPHNFPEDEARAFLGSKGEVTLKTKILEQIDLSLSDFKDKTIEVYFFGIDIATYRNGEITLKI